MTSQHTRSRSIAGTPVLAVVFTAAGLLLLLLTLP